MIKEYINNVSSKMDKCIYGQRNAKNKILEKPVEVIHFATGNEAALMLQPRNLIVLEKNSQAEIIETHQSLTSNPIFTNSVTEIFVDQDALKKAQLAGDVLAGHEVLMDAYNTDVRGLLREWRSDKGIDPEPMKAYAASGYAKKIATDRVGGNQAGWGA